MPRRPRQEITFSNTLYHIVARGNNQRRIFRSTRDYRKLLKIVEDTKKKYPFYFYSYNLIPNHYHFYLETIDVSISKIMHQINSSFVKYFRRRYGGAGHLFQGRFFSGLINKESYFWEAARYVDLNAVRAGLVEKPEDYQWSSYSIYYQKDYQGKLIDRDKFLQYSRKNLEKSRLDYIKFVEEGLKAKNPPFPISISKEAI